LTAAGFAVGSLDGHDKTCHSLCRDTGCVVISVGYRLAPEHKYPAGPDNCLAAARWRAEHAAELHTDHVRLVLAGDSAGGNLAAFAAFLSRKCEQISA
jgi:acetyl esterase